MILVDPIATARLEFRGATEAETFRKAADYIEANLGAGEFIVETDMLVDRREVVFVLAVNK